MERAWSAFDPGQPCHGGILACGSRVTDGPLEQVCPSLDEGILLCHPFLAQPLSSMQPPSSCRPFPTFLLERLATGKARDISANSVGIFRLNLEELLPRSGYLLPILVTHLHPESTQRRCGAT